MENHSKIINLESTLGDQKYTTKERDTAKLLTEEVLEKIAVESKQSTGLTPEKSLDDTPQMQEALGLLREMATLKRKIAEAGNAGDTKLIVELGKAHNELLLRYNELLKAAKQNHTPESLKLSPAVIMEDPNEITAEISVKL